MPHNMILGRRANGTEGNFGDCADLDGKGGNLFQGYPIIGYM